MRTPIYTHLIQNQFDSKKENQFSKTECSFFLKRILYYISMFV